MKQKKKKLILIYSVILVVLLLVLSTSYAYFSAQLSGNETSSTIITDSGSMNIIYADGDPNIVAHNIAPDNNPFANKTFTVTGTNDTALIMPIHIIINNRL